MYESDITQFIKELKAAKPDLEARQRQGRALLWDKQIDRDFAAAAKTASVPQKPYVYGTEPTYAPDRKS
ncbi:MAG: DUF3460 family protein [Burkholderiaceae bacterium]